MENLEIVMNETKMETQTKILKNLVANRSWEWFKGDDRWNYHLITDKGSRLQSIAYKNYKKEMVQYWSLLKRNGERINGIYEFVTKEFIKDYNNG